MRMRDAQKNRSDSEKARPAQRRTYRTREERRTEIISATLAILSEQGMHAWTTSALAARVGVSEATLFRHFRSKDEILIAALRDLIQSIQERIESYREDGTPWERARGLVFHVLDFVRDSGGGPLLIMTGEASRILPAVRDDVNSTRLLFRGRLTELMEEALEGTGHPHELDPGDVADLIIAIVHSSGLRWVVSEARIPLRETAGRMLDVVAHRLGGREVKE